MACFKFFKISNFELGIVFTICLLISGLQPISHSPVITKQGVLIDASQELISVKA